VKANACAEHRVAPIVAKDKLVHYFQHKITRNGNYSMVRERGDERRNSAGSSSCQAVPEWTASSLSPDRRSDLEPEKPACLTIDNRLSNLIRDSKMSLPLSRSLCALAAVIAFNGSAVSSSTAAWRLN